MNMYLRVQGRLTDQASRPYQYRWSLLSCRNQIFQKHSFSWLCLHRHYRHFVLSNFAGYHLVQDKIIYIWDVQRREHAVKAEKEKNKQQTKEAALWSQLEAQCLSP